MNPAIAFGVTFSDELIRCGLREVVLVIQTLEVADIKLEKAVGL